MIKTIIESKNVHMEHLEDIVIKHGVVGARQAINFLQALRIFTSFLNRASASKRLLQIQLGQLRLNPPGLGSKCGKRVERLSDF